MSATDSRPSSEPVFLPGDDTPAALVANDSGRFECRWVTLAPVAERRSIWLDGLTSNLRCPVAHAEGKLVADGALNVAFRYVGPMGAVLRGLGADGEIDPDYPANPNGSAGAAAGLVDDTGFVLGLMPHPEDHIHPRQDPLRGRADGGNCLPLFQAGVTAVPTDRPTACSAGPGPVRGVVRRGGGGAWRPQAPLGVLSAAGWRREAEISEPNG